jgi:predicted protein tyrosine phosphatase
MAIISIQNPGMTPIEFPPGLVGLLALEFDDCDGPEDGKVVYFNEYHAKAIWTFVEAVWGRAEALLIHCNLGSSRSPAVAAAIDKVKTGDDTKWFTTKSPNRFIFRTMLKVAIELGLWGKT